MNIEFPKSPDNKDKLVDRLSASPISEPLSPGVMFHSEQKSGFPEIKG